METGILTQLDRIKNLINNLSLQIESLKRDIQLQGFQITDIRACVQNIKTQSPRNTDDVTGD